MKGLFFIAVSIFISHATLGQGHLSNTLGLSADMLLASKNRSIADIVTDEFTSYSYYETGELKSVKPISDGKLEGELLSFYRDGSLRRREFFENGESIGGICFDIEGNVSTYEPFMTYAQLRGNLEVTAFVDMHHDFIFRTKKSLDINELKVVLKINQKGKMVGYEFLTKVDNGTRERLSYVLRQMTDWYPAIEEGVQVPMEYELTIR
ncbi:toxin-antitoxin system YwqK family antitoxin [Anditalea andensis]|uniref:Uncharacterized protein n=1 Tax=Anditalea andensis TaxID=1048983 RepID=A0A074L2U1_9BACT|nr:hypothetical protein [Anditalea andensis]KEO74158.1 hypothetical protein EL17_08445 [Anditalea andensis]